MALNENLKLDDFAKEFLKAYLENGFSTMTKREIDLLVLRLLVKHRGGWSWDDPPSAFDLSRELRVKRSRIRSMMDELSFRHQAEEQWAKERIRKIIQSWIADQRDELFEDGKIRLQIEDGFLREYAKSLVEKDYGIVDSSFDRSIVVLSGDKFLALVLKMMPADAYGAIESELEKHKEQLGKVDRKGLVRAFVEQVVKGAGQEVGKQAVNLGVTALTGGTDKIAGLVQRFFDRRPKTHVADAADATSDI